MEYYIYVVKCLHDKYFIGRTDSPNEKLEDQIVNINFEWTEKYTPIEMIEFIKENDIFLIDKKTKEYMIVFGINNVRGGRYTQLCLTDSQYKTIKHEIYMDKLNPICSTCNKTSKKCKCINKVFENIEKKINIANELQHIKRIHQDEYDYAELESLIHVLIKHGSCSNKCCKEDYGKKIRKQINAKKSIKDINIHCYCECRSKPENLPALHKQTNLLFAEHSGKIFKKIFPNDEYLKLIECKLDHTIDEHHCVFNQCIDKSKYKYFINRNDNRFKELITIYISYENIEKYYNYYFDKITKDKNLILQDKSI